MTSGDLPRWTIAQLASALRDRELSATELTEIALERIAARDGALNAFALVDEDGARRAARTAQAELCAGHDRGPLHGMPVAVKDLVDIAGQPTTCGSASSAGTAQADRDAEIVTRLRRAGAVIVGKTTLHELAYGATGDRSVHGPSRNPHDTARMSGGSSGGSAVAVAAGMVALAVGTDTVGSVRVPAALCGVTGFKPAHDAIPTGGVHPLAPSLDHVGLLAGTAADVTLASAELGGHVPSAATTVDAASVGWIGPEELTAIDARIASPVRELVVRACGEPAVVRGVAPAAGRPSLFEVVSTVQSREAFAVHADHLDADRALIDEEVVGRLEAGRAVSDDELAGADRERRAFASVVGSLLETHDVLALPTVPVTAPEIDRRRVRIGGGDHELRRALLSLTSPWNLVGVPAVSVPAGTVDGLPIGVQLVTARGRESLMLAVADRLERARPTTHHDQCPAP